MRDVFSKHAFTILNDRRVSLLYTVIAGDTKTLYYLPPERVMMVVKMKGSDQKGASS